MSLSKMETVTGKYTIQPLRHMLKGISLGTDCTEVFLLTFPAVMTGWAFEL